MILSRASIASQNCIWLGDTGEAQQSSARLAELEAQIQEKQDLVERLEQDLLATKPSASRALGLEQNGGGHDSIANSQNGKVL